MIFSLPTKLILVGILLSIVGVEFPAFSQEPSHKNLEYEVKVNVRMVPMFAVDKKGQPVYDLKQEEMELLVNGKPFDILYFHGFKMASKEQNRVSREKAAAAVTTATPAPRTRMPERINFIIIDSLISNMSTLEPSRIIVNRIIAQASANDAFVILESNQLEGFQYVAGPEKDKQKLYQVMAGMEKRFMRRRIQQKWLRHLSATTQGHNGAASEEALVLLNFAEHKAKNERSKYQKDLLRFSKSLKQLKLALQSTPLAKTIFLITAGHVTEGMGKNPVTYMRFLEEAAKEVSRGGALFYVINPLMQGDTQFATRMKYMADAAGGRMISGKTVSEVVTRVKQSTSAYYEMAFSPKNLTRKKYRIDVRCKRKGVTLTTITHSEKNRSYLEMKKTQRKLFVLNVINGGFWSRTLARVERVKYQKPAASTNEKRKSMEITVPLPIEMQFKKLHLFQVEIDAQTQEAHLNQSIDTPGESLNMTLRLKRGKLYYFVIIDPKKPACIYNIVR